MSRTPHTINVEDIRDFMARYIFAQSNGATVPTKRLIIETYVSTRTAEFVVTQDGTEMYRGHNIGAAVEVYNQLP